MHGVFQTQKRDHMMRPQSFPSPDCILCPAGGQAQGDKSHLDAAVTASDGCGHVMGGCRHRDLNACYIKRHNEAVALIAQAIAGGKKGRWLLVTDLNKETLVGIAAQVGHEVHNRIPKEKLPAVPEADRIRLRPDILFLEGAEDGHGTGTSSPPRKKGKFKKKAYIIEVGYGRDCAAADKRAEKEAQHKILAGHLKGAGWEVVTTTVVLGHCGSVYLEDMKKMEELGVERKPTEKLFKDLHSNAIRYTCSAARLYQQLRAERNRELGQRWTNGRRRAKPP